MHKSKTFIDLENSDEPVISKGAAGKAPAGLSQMIDDEAQECEGFACAFCGLVSCRCAYDIDAQEDEQEEIPEDELEEESAPITNKRNARFDYEEGEEQPDLAAYFDQFTIDEQQQIAICRTYANYLAQRLRSKFGPTGTRTWKPRSKAVKGGNPRWKRIRVRQPVFEEEQE